MTKVMLLKNAEISVTEEKKGKQIAVKENNIVSLKEFYFNNVSQVNTNSLEQQQETAVSLNEEGNKSSENAINEQLANTPINETVEEKVNVSSIEDTQNIQVNDPINQVEIAIPSIETNKSEQTTDVEEKIEEKDSENSGANDAPVINLVPETEDTEIKVEEEMDPELKAIKERLDQVISDLNNYKKKIKLLEDEVNQNLEKSREVLKDTQAAAKIMSIQQERQRQITEESGGTSLETDPSRTLQKVA
ncbi:MAG: hypothetical protein HFI09_00735 [Bacilli bacterium]|nr:hypothetical protein [Bacilli bacterium]